MRNRPSLVRLLVGEGRPFGQAQGRLCNRRRGFNRRLTFYFRYAEAYAPLPDAYETLLLDILSGDQTLFVRVDEVETAWRLSDLVLKQRPQVQPYPAGT